jgi:hypothetical protein
MNATQAFELTTESQARKIVTPAIKGVLGIIKAEAKKGIDVAQYRNPALDGSEMAQKMFQERIAAKGFYVEVTHGQSGSTFLVHWNPESVLKAKQAQDSKAASEPAAAQATTSV